MERVKIRSIIESLIFASLTPLPLSKIEAILVNEVKPGEIKKILDDIIWSYNSEEKGIYVVEVAGGYQFRTKPQNALWIQQLESIRTYKLSNAALEVLAIIAYKQPITKGEIEKIRQIDSSGVIKTLLEKEIIKVLGRQKTSGHPIIYGTTKKFLEIFGLKDLSELPKLEDFKKLVNKVE